MREAPVTILLELMSRVPDLSVFMKKKKKRFYEFMTESEKAMLNTHTHIHTQIYIYMNREREVHTLVFPLQKTWNK